MLGHVGFWKFSQEGFLEECVHPGVDRVGGLSEQKEQCERRGGKNRDPVRRLDRDVKFVDFNEIRA